MLQMKFPELIARVGVAPRQVRYMISEGFVPSPTGGRAHARYSEVHIQAINRYVRLKELGFTPATIKALQRTDKGVPYPVAEGITLVISPDLIASGIETEPLVKLIGKRLEAIVNKQRGPS